MRSIQTRSIFLTLPILLLTLLLLAGCGKNGYGGNSGTNPPPPGNTPNLVTIVNFSFSPQAITVSAGDTLTWRNDDNVGHTVTSDTGSELNSPVLSHGQTYQHIFSASGSYPYHCSIHTNMTGTVTVPQG